MAGSITKKTPDKVAQLQLASLAQKINHSHAMAEEAAEATREAAGSALRHAAEAGKFLAEAKELQGHGKWLDWLTENFAGSERTARDYLKLYKSFPRLVSNRQNAADLSIREALKLLSSIEPEAEKGAPKPSPAATNDDKDSGRPSAGEDRDEPTEEERTEQPQSPAPVTGVARDKGAGVLASASHGVLPGNDPGPPAPPDDAPRDDIGQPLPADSRIRAAFASRVEFDAVLELLKQARAKLNPLLGDASQIGPAAGGDCLAVRRQQVLADLKNLRESVKWGRPYALCPYAHGRHPCEACHATGWVTRSVYEAAPREHRKGDAA
jgi:hypothetical protein